MPVTGAWGAFDGNEEYQVALNKVLGGLAAAAVTGDENDFDTGADRAETVHRYNYLEHAQIDAWANEMQACQAGGGSCGHVNEKFEKLSIAQQEKLISVCAADATACQQQFGSVVTDSLLVKQSIDNALGQDIPLKMVYDLSALRLHQSDAEGAILSAQFAKDLSEKYGLDADTITLAAGLLANAATGLPIKGPEGGTGTSNVKENSGAENISTYPKLKNDLKQQNLDNIVAYDHRLAIAIKGDGSGKVDFGMGAGTRSESDRLGMIWVGDGARQTSQGGWISADGTRGYRPPSEKDTPFATTGVQANFERYEVQDGKRIKVGNSHLNITD